MDSIIAQGEKTFDEQWMQTLFNRYWEYARWATQWSNMLLQPPAPHVIELLTAATKIQKIANKLANGFNNPAGLFPWIEDTYLTKDMIAHLRFQEIQEKLSVGNYELEMM